MPPRITAGGTRKASMMTDARDRDTSSVQQAASSSFGKTSLILDSYSII